MRYFLYPYNRIRKTPFKKANKRFNMKPRIEIQKTGNVICPDGIAIRTKENSGSD